MIPNFIFSIETVVVSKQKLVGVPHEDAIFHLKEQPTILLSTEIAKIAIEEVTKDVAFIEVEIAE
ncbi:hypothetical protein AGMMS49579_18660 [Spirochaetia bacterium]|nr:hypothetical protein AGMMS49579_18660 [Spirochaetia bacterium]